MNPEEVTLALQALRAAEGCARGLARSRDQLREHFPLSPAAIETLPAEVEDDLDAFLKRYEQLVNIVQLCGAPHNWTNGERSVMWSASGSPRRGSALAAPHYWGLQGLEPLEDARVLAPGRSR